MPSSSLKQHNLMAMVANDPAKAKQMGIPQSVGQEFAQADKGMKFSKAPTKSRADLQKVNKPETRHGGSQLFKQGGQIMVKEARMMPAKMEKGGDLKKGNKPHGEHAVQEKGHTKARMPKMAGNTVGNGPAVLTHGTYKKGGMTKKSMAKKK